MLFESDGQGSSLLKKSTEVGPGISKDVAFEDVLLLFDSDDRVTVVGCRLEGPDTDVVESSSDGQGSSMVKKLNDVDAGMLEEVPFEVVVVETADEDGLSLSPIQ